MICEGAKRSWLDVVINGAQGSGGCGRDGDLAGMNGSCDPIDLMPADPFGMNAGSTSAATAGWTEHNPYDYEVCAGDPFLEIIEMMNNNYSQVSGGCGREEDWVKMNRSFDPLYLLPTDPFQMNRESEINVIAMISELLDEWNGGTTGDCALCAAYPDLYSGYYQSQPFLSSFETRLNSATDFNKVGPVEESSFSGELCAACPDLFSSYYQNQPFLPSLETQLNSATDFNKVGPVEESSFSGELCAACPDLFSSYYQNQPFLPSLETQLNSATDFNEVGAEEQASLSGGLRAAHPDLYSSYYQNQPFLPSLETQLNSATDFNKVGAEEQASFSGRDFSEPVSNETVDDSILALVVGRCFSGSDLDVAGDGSLGACENVEGVLDPGGRDAIDPDGDVNSLHGGLILSLGYLGVRDLLSAEMVCRSLRSAVKNDPLLWRCIHIDSSLADKMTDGDLYRLARRAEGKLRCLILVQCPNITFDGLIRVLDSNPMLKMLNMPGFIRLTPDGDIKNLKTFELSDMPQKLGRHFIGSVKDFEDLRFLVAADEPILTNARKLHFFHDEICQSKPDHCRACCACVQRCADCGRCLDNCRYIETFFLDNICSACADRSPEILAEKGIY